VVDVAYAGPPVPIPDADSAGASVPLAVSGVGRISGITFSIDGTECSTAEGSTTVGLDHTFVADLAGTLTAPDGTRVTLFSRVGGGGNNFCQTVFDDSAERSITSATSAEAPFTGRWRPTEPLSVLKGRPADGTWTFTVQDTAAVDTGSIRAVSLHVAGYAGSGSTSQR
jgi:subtilisin-like proprotein convertase family protein